MADVVEIHWIETPISKLIVSICLVLHIGKFSRWIIIINFKIVISILCFRHPQHVFGNWSVKLNVLTVMDEKKKKKYTNFPILPVIVFISISRSFCIG